MGQSSSAPTPQHHGWPSADLDTPIAATAPDLASERPDAWDRFTYRCGRFFRRGRRSIPYSRIPGSSSARVATTNADQVAPKESPRRSASNAITNAEADNITDILQSDSRNWPQATPPALALAPESTSAPPPPPPPQTRPPDPPRPSRSNSAWPSTIGDGVVRDPIDPDGLWTDLIAQHGRRRYEPPAVPLTSPPSAGDSPLVRMSQALAIVATITARQLIGQRSDTLLDDHFFPLFNSLLEDVQNSEGGSIFTDPHDVNISRENENDGYSDTENEAENEAENDDSDRGAENSQRRRGYLRMFRFPANDADLVPVIIVSMRPADQESLSDFVPHTPPASRDTDEFPWNSSLIPATPTSERLNESDSAEFEDSRSTDGDHDAHTSEQSDHSERPGSRARSREEVQMAWIIYVFGGTYPRNHPIFMAPSLLTDNPTYEDMMYIQELMGPHKPPVASATELERLGGLFTVTHESQALLERCAVCLGGYAEGDSCRKLGCNHQYHQMCIDKWLREGQNTCPLCRETGAPKEEEVQV